MGHTGDIHADHQSPLDDLSHSMFATNWVDANLNVQGQPIDHGFTLIKRRFSCVDHTTISVHVLVPPPLGTSQPYIALRQDY